MKILFIIAVVLVGVIIIVYGVFENPHSFQNHECATCHVDSELNPKTMRAPVTELCKRCHKKITRRSSHPVDVRPVTARIPSDLVLQDGKITCNTCHNVHGDRFTQFGGKTYFLRRPVTGREFCISCHTTRIPTGGHQDILGIAHIGTKFLVTDPTQPLDPLSMECITCHSGTTGKMVDFGIGVWSHETSSHPVGVNYRESRMKNGNLKPLSSVNKKIKLFSGRIGCGTCHDAYSKIANHLVASNEGSKLCIQCHDL